jgi:polyhydroxyalkanoate synthase
VDEEALTMEYPGNRENLALTQSNAASQRGEILAARERGPHPLPGFLETVARVCGGDRERLRGVLAGLRRYQTAPHAAPRPERPEVARSGSVTLRDHGRHGDEGGPIVVIVPSLINSPVVLDLAPGNSLLESMANSGMRPLLVDWGATDPAGLAGIVETRLAPLIASLNRPVALAGYCLGGTLALGAAALLGDGVSRVALLAAPWCFDGYDSASREALSGWWRDTAPLAETLGAVPMDLLQPAFWSLDPDGLAAKYAQFAALPPGPAAATFVAVEDWSNSGQPLSLAAMHELADGFFTHNLPGRGEWRIAGQRIDPSALRMPILDVVALRDRIVAPQAALSASGIGTRLAIDAGHVGMVVGRSAPTRLWAPLSGWLRG